MIRRDYIIRMIAEFLEMLSRLQSLKNAERWQEANGTLEEHCRRVLDLGLGELVKLSETELLARIIQGEPTQVVRDKVFVITRLLKEAGDVASGRGELQHGREYYLKALHLLLYTLAQGSEAEWPEFVPRVDMIVAALADAPLPLATYAGLMQHYEVTRQFGKAEDAFFRLLEAAPDRKELVDFGVAFYERLRSHADAVLEEGNLPRAELQSGLEELLARRAS